MKQIQVERTAARAATSPDRESGQTSARSSSARAPGEPLDEGTQMTGTEVTAATTAAKTATGAPSDRSVDWHSIDWNTTHTHVKRLQARIAKAAQAGRQGKVKALQWILTHSFSAKAEAVRRVTENHGKNTPGVDKETWGTPAKKSEAVRRMGRRRDYTPSPLRRIYIPKTSNPKKLRPLSIPIWHSYCTPHNRYWE